MYTGERIYSCDIGLFRYQEAYLIYVTGDWYNPCGHVLLNFGGREGYYLHVVGFRHYYPEYMNEVGYQRYLKEDKKTELERTWVHLPYPSKALLFLEQRLNEFSYFKLIWDNCATFVREILKNGGVNTLGMISNCPRIQDIFDRVEGRS